MIVSVVALAGLGALAFVAARIAGAFGQLQAVAVVQPAHTPSLSAGGASMAGGAVVVNAEPPAEVPADAGTPDGSGGDEHILRALAADPEFARAADELLNDPDPQTRADAQQLLRDLR